MQSAHEKIGKPFVAPELYMSPSEIGRFLSELLSNLGGETDYIGSSLGGFYAAWAKENLGGGRAVLLNPALGNWGKVNFKSGWYDVNGTEKKMYVCPNFMDELEEMLIKKIQKPRDYLSLISLRDEVLDCSVALNFLKETRIIKIPNGDHRITDFAPHVAEIMNFLTKEE